MIDDPMWGRVQVWALLRDAFERAEELFADAERLRDAADAPARVPAAYARRRTALRDSLGVVDGALTAYVGRRAMHQCLVALISSIDERERAALGARCDEWALAPLQTELLGIDDGGDRFFDELAEIVARPDTHGLVLEVYLLCLRSGFVGRLRDRRYELEQATAALRERVRGQPRHAPVDAAAAEAGTGAGPARRQRVAFVAFPLRYYLVAAGAVLAAYATLRVISHHEVVDSPLADYCHYGEAAPDGVR